MIVIGIKRNFESFVNILKLTDSVSGIVLLIVPNRKVKKAANIILLVAKLLNLYSHFAIDDPFERMAPTLVFFFMLVCRMVVDWQFVKGVQQQVLTNQNQNTTTSYNSMFQAEVEEQQPSGSYDKVNLRPSLPRQAKNKKDQ